MAPELVERVLLQSPLVSEIFIWGTSTMHQTAAVVVPSASVAEPDAGGLAGGVVMCRCVRCVLGWCTLSGSFVILN